MALRTPSYFLSAFLLSVLGLLSFLDDESPGDSLDDESFDDAFADSPSDDEPEEAGGREDLLG